MAEAVGFVASIIAVAGLAGQLIKGCQNVKELVGDFKSAPKDIQALIQELETIEDSAKLTDIIGNKVSPEDVDLHLAPALQQCYDAVQELRTSIEDASNNFQARANDKVARGWHRLKVMLGKRGIQAQVDKLSRAKMQLVVVQSNILLYSSQCQQEKLEHMTLSLSSTLDTYQNSASVLKVVDNNVRDIYEQTESTNMNVNLLNANIIRWREELQQQSKAPDMVASFEKTVENALAKHKNEFTHGYTRQMQRESVKCLNIEAAERNTPCRKFDAALSRTGYRTSSKVLTQNPIVTALVNTSLVEEQDKEREIEDDQRNLKGAGHAYHSITTIDILINLGLWRRGFKGIVGHSSRAYTPSLDFRLNTYHIVEKHAPIFQACKIFDIEAVRNMFASGHASPFDQDISGNSVFDHTFHELCRSCCKKEAADGLRLLKYIADCGGMPTSLSHKRGPGNFPWVERVMMNGNPECDQAIAEATRLVLQTSSDDPMSNWNTGLCMTLEFQRNPIAQTMLQQSQWSVDFGPWQREVLGRFRIYENDRQIIGDKDAVVLATLLTGGKEYMTVDLPGWNAPNGLQSLLYLYHKSHRQTELRAGCRNRLALLLNIGFDPRNLTSCPYDQKIQGNLNMTVTQYAKFTNTLDLWQESLLQVGWTSKDIEDLLDEELYKGIPALLNETLEFKSLVENREEFRQILATGGLIRGSSRDSWLLSTYLCMYIDTIAVTIEEAQHIFSEKTTPGSWHEDGIVELAFGRDFFICTRRWIRDDWVTFRYASFDQHDRYYGLVIG